MTEDLDQELEEIKKLPGLTREQLQKCCICEQGMMHNNNITFYRIQLERFLVDHRAVRERAGLEIMLGSVPLAEVFTSHSELARQCMKPRQLLVCEDCMVQRLEVVLEREPIPA